MRVITTWLVILFVAAVSGDTTSSEEQAVTKIEKTTEASLTVSTTEKPPDTDDDGSKSIRDGKLRENDKTDLATDKDIMLDDLIMKIVDGIDGEDELIQEQNQKNSYPDDVENNQKTDDVDNNPENPRESKISKDFMDIRRQEASSKVNQENSSPGIQFDDSKTEVISDPQQRYGQRSPKFRQNIQDSAPLLQLTQGGYERPYKRLRYRERYSARPDSSEQSENVQQLDRKSDSKKLDTNRIVPQETYAPSSQPPYAYGQGPLMNTPFDSSARNLLALNQIIPPSAQNGFFNSPPPDFARYSNDAFQPQFAPSTDVGSIPSFSSDPNNAGMYQTVPSNPFQTPGILFQNSPQMQPQPVLIDAGRSGQAQFQQNPLPTYSGYQTMEDNSNPNYASFFTNPTMNTPFQVPPNFYGNAPNAINPFNNPPITFLSQYPNVDNRALPQLFQYPDMTTGAQNSEQSSNNQQFVPDASQDENKAKIVVQNTDKPVNRDDSVPAQFGTSVQTDNIANVFMRYPTVEAGYAIEENLPMQNNSNESKDGDKRSKEEPTNNPNADPNKTTRNSVHGNNRINNSFGFPPELFRSLPLDFGYQRPQDQIFTQYPGRNRATPNYASRNFESRIPFNSIASLPENIFGVSNQHKIQHESNETPSCAKENNISICFEDNNYPKDDILYTISTNSFLNDILLNPQPSLDSFSFVERNGNETEQSEENYACDVVTKYGTPLRAKNIDGMWRIVVSIRGRFSQPLRMEVCKTLGSSCSHTDTRIKTACVQKFSLQRLLTWSPSRGIYSDVYKIPVACSCQITEAAEH